MNKKSTEWFLESLIQFMGTSSFVSVFLENSSFKDIHLIKINHKVEIFLNIRQNYIILMINISHNEPNKPSPKTFCVAKKVKMWSNI